MTATTKTAKPRHPRAVAAQMSHSPKLAARATGLTQAEVRAIRDLQAARHALRRSMATDPLIRARASRPYRRPSAVAAAEAKQAAAMQAIYASLDHDRRRQEAAEARRASLLAAARAARKLGYQVRASHGRGGRISSYYCTLPARPALRISDHDIPQTARRDHVARMNGRDYFNGYHGAQIIIDRPRSATWLRRAIVLTAAGRSVP